LLSRESLVISGGTLTLVSDSEVSPDGALTLSGGTLQGSGTLTVYGPATWSSGTIRDPGVTTFNGTLLISGSAPHELRDRTLNLNGTTTWTNVSTGNQGRIRTGFGATINNAGLFEDKISTATAIANDLGGTASTFNNTGSYAKSGTATTTISIGFNN